MSRLLLPSAVLPALLLVLLSALPAAAHTEIESSTPAADSTVADPPSELLVTFSGDLDPGSAVQVRVVDPAGDDLVAGEVVVEGREVAVPLNLAVAEGIHTVDVAFTAADGDDQVETFTFTFAPPAAVATPTEDLTGAPVEPATEPASEAPATQEPPTEEPTATPTAEPTPTAAPTASEDADAVSDGGVGALPVVVAVLAAVGAVAFLTLRRRDPDQYR